MSDLQTETRAWATLRGVLRYLRRVNPRRQACEEWDPGDKDRYGPCWTPGWATFEEAGDCCAICTERYHTTEAIKLVQRLLYAANRRLERAAGPTPGEQVA